MTNNKPLGEWTLNEVKAECEKRDVCREKCPIFDNNNQICKLGIFPSKWEFSPPPRFTSDEEAALRVLKAAGFWKIWRGQGEHHYLYADHKSGSIYMFPEEMFPGIKPGQEVML